VLLFFENTNLMWFPAKDAMAGGNAATAFLALRWNEMFDGATPDSYQPRLSNTPSLIRDICVTAERLKHSAKWERHFKVLQEELRAVSEEESDVLAFSGYYQWLVGQFHTQSPERVLALARVAEDFESGYRESVRVNLVKASATLPKTKQAATIALQRWATIMVQGGCQSDEMIGLADEASFDLSTEKFIERLVGRVNCGSSPFWCCLSVTGPFDDIRALSRNVGFDLVKAKKLETEQVGAFKADAEKIAPQEAHGTTLVAGTYDGKTASEAARRAIRSLRNAIDVCNFYSEAAQIRILPQILTRSAAGDYKRVEIGVHQMKRRLPRRARELTLTTLDRVPSENLDGRILNALEHYDLAHSSTATQVKLVNMWTALECLAGSGDSIIGAACDLVAPIIVWRRSDKILNYAASCLNEYRKLETVKPFPAGLLTTSGEAVSREKLLLILAKPADHPDLKALCDFVADHPLLLFRLKELWDAFSNPKQLLKELQRSKARVTWHLFRIYRSRNLIVHEGYDPSHLTQSLLDNLHYYFSVTLSRILHGMQIREGISVDGSIAYWRSRSDFMLDRLERGQSQLRVMDFFARAASDAHVIVWPQIESRESANGDSR